MQNKTKITEKEFFEKLCQGCGKPIIGKDCIQFKNNHCLDMDLIKRFDVFEIIQDEFPDKLTTLEKIRLAKQNLKVQGAIEGIKLGCDVISYTDYLIIVSLYDKLLEEILNERVKTTLNSYEIGFLLRWLDDVYDTKEINEILCYTRLKNYGR